MSPWFRVNVHFRCVTVSVASYVLQGAERLRGLQAGLLQSVYGLQDGLTRVHGPVELMVHVPPEPTRHTHTLTVTNAHRQMLNLNGSLSKMLNPNLLLHKLSLYSLPNPYLPLHKLCIHCLTPTCPFISSLYSLPNSYLLLNNQFVYSPPNPYLHLPKPFLYSLSNPYLLLHKLSVFTA